MLMFQYCEISINTLNLNRKKMVNFSRPLVITMNNHNGKICAFIALQYL